MRARERWARTLDSAAGEARIDLRYTPRATNWLGRARMALGALILVGGAAGPRFRCRRRAAAT